jgi:hypothetical protein
MGWAVPTEANGSPQPQTEQAQDEFIEKIEEIVIMKVVRPKRLNVLDICYSLMVGMNVGYGRNTRA